MEVLAKRRKQEQICDFPHDCGTVDTYESLPSYHRFSCRLLELHQSHPRHGLNINVAVVAAVNVVRVTVKVVTRHWRCHVDRCLPVHFVCRHIVGLQRPLSTAVNYKHIRLEGKNLETISQFDIQSLKFKLISYQNARLFSWENQAEISRRH